MGRINRRRDRWLKRGLEFALRPFFRRPARTLAQIEAMRPRRILLVRQHNQMGDMLCAVPAFRAIHERFPAARKLLITAPVNHGVMAGNPYLDEILLFDKVALRRSPVAALRFVRQLRAFAPDLAFVLNSVSFSGTSAWLAVLSGARNIVGGDSVPFGWSFSRWLYNLQMPANPVVAGHAIDHQLAPLAAIGITTRDRSTVVCPSAEAQGQAASFHASLGQRPHVALHPGAGKRENRWPADRFAQIAQRLRAANATVYLIEGPADVAATREVQTHAAEPLPVLRDVPLSVVAAALGQSDLVLVNDTGIMHVAGAMGARTLALFGPTPMAAWRPPSPRLCAVAAADGRMESIPLDAVWNWFEAELSSLRRTMK
jgi:heptosyltransferase-2